jgi:hypothetical protein
MDTTFSFGPDFPKYSARSMNRRSGEANLARAGGGANGGGSFAGLGMSTRFDIYYGVLTLREKNGAVTI